MTHSPGLSICRQCLYICCLVVLSWQIMLCRCMLVLYAMSLFVIVHVSFTDRLLRQLRHSSRQCSTEQHLTHFNGLNIGMDVCPHLYSHCRHQGHDTGASPHSGTGNTFCHKCRYAKQRALQRAEALKANVRVVKQQPTPVLALLLQSLFSTQVSSGPPLVTHAHT